MKTLSGVARLTALLIVGYVNAEVRNGMSRCTNVALLTVFAEATLPVRNHPN